MAPAALRLQATAPPDRASLAARYAAVRAASEALCAPLAIEDYVVQSMPDTSPAKWHLAHPTWFFEHFVLEPFAPGYTVFHPQYGFLFNSYYETVGRFHPRRDRGLLSRPTVEEIRAYRRAIDNRVAALLGSADASRLADIALRVELGLHHEEQHQELLLTDLKHLYSINPLQPAYRELPVPRGAAGPLAWRAYDEAVRSMGADGGAFAFDNETPRHRVLMPAFRIASRPATNGEWLAFMDAGGYRRPELWLSEGWKTVNERGWQAPLYWEQHGGEWRRYTLGGPRPVDVEAPVCHVSFYEADAFARWCGKRLPTEAEWEIAAAAHPVRGNLRDSGLLDPAPAAGEAQWYGDVWEWTASPYVAYPGFRPLDGSLGEYNGKFMCNQLVLRGGSCVTPANHVRATYRNFFYAPDRWQFMGVRLAQDA
jgi:ergothioneine biosynthesis protein EgtB